MAYKEFYEQLLEEQTSMSIQDDDDDIRDAFLDDPESEIALADEEKVKELIDKIPADDDIPEDTKKECEEACKESADLEESCSKCEEKSHKTNEDDDWDKMYNYDVYDDPTEPIIEDIDEDFLTDIDESFDDEDFMFESSDDEIEDEKPELKLNEFSKEDKEAMKNMDKKAIKESEDEFMFENDFDFNDEFMMESDFMDIEEAIEESDDSIDDIEESVEESEEEIFEDPALEGDLADAYHDDKEYLAKYSTGSEDSKSFDKALQGDLNKDNLEDIYPDKDEFLVREDFEDFDLDLDFDFE